MHKGLMLPGFDAEYAGCPDIDPDRPTPEFVSRGPRTRREFLAALRAHVDP